jgi:hypothetical protein
VKRYFGIQGPRGDLRAVCAMQPKIVGIPIDLLLRSASRSAVATPVLEIVAPISVDLADLPLRIHALNGWELPPRGRRLLWSRHGDRINPPRRPSSRTDVGIANGHVMAKTQHAAQQHT